MTRLFLFSALATSLLVPAAGVAVAIAAVTSPPARYSPDESRPPTQFDKADLKAIHDELVALDLGATPGTTAQIAEARRIAREARAWAVHFEAEPEWEEFALATSALASVIADGLEHPETFSSRAYDRAVARERAAAEEALPIEPDGP
jgi:hypothetical protein